jgi:uncharacterized protein YndB with AHSA1/START domain
MGDSAIERGFPFTIQPLTLPNLSVPKTRTIRQTVWLPASPALVYEALMTSKGHAAFTGAKARISPRVGGRFEAWDGYIHGTNLELVPDRKIVQAWRPSEEDWPGDYDSKVTFLLAAYRKGTRVRFTHSGVLVQHAGHLSTGWKESYWGPLKKYLGPGIRSTTTRKRSSSRRSRS